MRAYISGLDGGAYILVTVHQDLAAMHGAAGQDDETRGCFIPSPHMLTVEDDGTSTKARRYYAGHMHLVAGWTTTEIVSHESVHAAAHITRMRLWLVSDDLDVSIGDNCGEVEEDFAHLVSTITAAVGGVIHGAT